MSKRKFYTWFLLLTLLIPAALTACGGGVEQAVEDAAQDAGDAVEEIVATAVPEIEEEEEVEVAPTAVPEVEEEEAEMEEMEEVDYDTDLYGHIDQIDLEGAQVTFWTRYDSGGRQEAMEAICADFNANNEYGITVECLPIGHYGILYDSMIAGLTTGDVPGLIVAYQNQAAAYQVADGLVALDPYISDAVYGLSADEQADVFQSFMDSDRLPQFGGQAYGFPAAGRSAEVLYYNADWLAELGYDGPPTTPDEFAEMVCAAKDQPFSKNESDFSTGIELDTDASSFASLIFARGGDIFDYENGAFTYNTPEAIEAMTLMQGLVENGCIAQIAEKYGDQTDFGNGKILFTQGSSSGLPFYQSSVDDGETGGFEWSVAPIPYTGSNPVTNIYGASISMAKTDPQTQLASWLFLKYWLQPENQTVWVTNSNYFPARNSVADGLSDYMEENAAFGVAFDLLQYGKAEAPVAGYDNIRDVVEEAFIDIIYNGADIESTLADLEAQANQTMEESAP